MLRYLIALLLFSCSPAAHGGDTDVDAVGKYDKEGALPAVRTLSASMDFDVPEAEWAACRGSAAVSLEAFDAWFASSSKAPEVKAFYAALPKEMRDKIRISALGLAP